MATPTEELNFNLRERALLKGGFSSAHKTGLNHLAPKEEREAPAVHLHAGGSMLPETPIHFIIALKMVTLPTEQDLEATKLSITDVHSL